MLIPMTRDEFLEAIEEYRRTHDNEGPGVIALTSAQWAETKHWADERDYCLLFGMLILSRESSCFYLGPPPVGQAEHRLDPAIGRVRLQVSVLYKDGWRHDLPPSTVDSQTLEGARKIMHRDLDRRMDELGQLKWRPSSPVSDSSRNRNELLAV